MQIYVAGPVWLFVGFPNASGDAYQAIGFSERGVTVSRSGLWENVVVDYGGNMPADVAALGQQARITGDFTSYNEDVVEACTSFVRGASLGGGDSWSVGTLMTLEQGSFPLILYCPYADVKSVYNGADVVNGSALHPEVAMYYFYSTYFSENIDVLLSVRRKAPRFTFGCIPIFGSMLQASGAPTNPPVFTPFEPPFEAYRMYTGYYAANIPWGTTFAPPFYMPTYTQLITYMRR